MHRQNTIPKTKALHVLSDLRRDPKLTVSQAAKNRGTSVRSLREEIGSQPIHYTISTGLWQTVYTKSLKEFPRQAI